jgi:hypothetical protein
MSEAAFRELHQIPGRWIVEMDPSGTSARVCRGEHAKAEPCEWEPYPPPPDLPRPVMAEAFHFTEPNAPCTYWCSGVHIVNKGVCRCGRYFGVVEVPASCGVLCIGREPD